MKQSLLIFSTLVKYDLKKKIINPASYISFALFSLGIGLYFFLFSNIFIYNGGTSNTASFFVFLNLFLIPFIAFFTMDLWIKDEINGQDSLIPTSFFVILLAKIISSLCFYVFLLFLSSILLLILHNFGSLDNVQIILSYSLLICIGFTGITLGAFINLCTKNSIISFIITCFILLFFHIAHFFPQYLGNSFVSDIFIALSFSWHFDDATKGIFNSKDFFFYIIFSFFMIVLSLFTLQKRKYNSKRFNKKTFFLTFSALILLLLNSQVYFIQKDMTVDKKFSLFPYTKALLQEIRAPLNIVYYYSENLEKLYPQIKDIQSFLTKLEYESSHVVVNLVNPDNSETEEKLLAHYGIIPQQLEKIEKNVTSKVNVYSGIILEYENFIQTIPFILSLDTLEFDFSFRLNNLLERTTPLIQLVMGNSLQISESYSYIKPWLENTGFICQETTFDSLDKNYPAIILGSSEINAQQTKLIEDFVLQGGKILFCVSSYDIAINDNWKILPQRHRNLLDLLNFWGIEIPNKMILSQINEKLSLINQKSGLSETLSYPFWIKSKNKQHSSLKNPNITFYWASPQYLFNDFDKTKSSVTYYSYPESIAESFSVDNFVSDPFMLQNYSIKSKESYNLISQIEGIFSGFYSIDDSVKTRIAVISDQYFLSNLNEYTNSFDNFTILIDTLLWITQKEDLLSLKNKITKPSILYKKASEDIFYADYIKSFMTYTLGLPFLFLCLMIIVSIVRREKKGEK